MLPAFLFRTACALFACGFALRAQTVFYPLESVRAGQKAVGRTVFGGTKVEEFQVEILGVLPNVSPKQSLIFAKLSGGPLAQTGVMQGMSGSPVYLNGQLLGAVAFAFPFSKEAIAGIRPIRQMLYGEDVVPTRARRMEDLAPVAQRAVPMGESRLTPIATPLAISGFTRATLDHFAPQLRALGLEPQQAATGGGGQLPAAKQPAVAPGDMITVQLIGGDMSIGADGTVTHVDGNTIYAFGHQFMELGETQLPFAKSSVLTLLPNLSNSFKISAPMELAGTIVSDRSAGVTGTLGVQPKLVAMRVRVTGAGKASHSYRMALVHDAVLTPFLAQMAVFNVLDATQRMAGSTSIAIRGSLTVSSGARIPVDQVYAGDYLTAQQAALGVSLPMAVLLQAGFADLRVTEIDLDLTVTSQKLQWNVDQLLLSKRRAQRGETVRFAATFAGPDGTEQARPIDFTIPARMTPGTYQATLSDATLQNLIDYQRLVTASPLSPADLTQQLTRIRPSSKAYLRITRADGGATTGTANLPALPGSVANLLQRDASNSLGRLNTVAEIEIPLDGRAITGSKTITLEVTDTNG